VLPGGHVRFDKISGGRVHAVSPFIDVNLVS
jgi:hypothetical protein